MKLTFVRCGYGFSISDSLLTFMLGDPGTDDRHGYLTNERCSGDNGTRTKKLGGWGKRGSGEERTDSNITSRCRAEQSRADKTSEIPFSVILRFTTPDENVC